MSARTVREAQAKIAELRRTGLLATVALMVLGVLALISTMFNVASFSLLHHSNAVGAWLLDPMLNGTLLAVLYLDDRMSSQGLVLSGWSTTVRWFAGLGALLANLWQSIYPDGWALVPQHADAGGLFQHMLAPGLVVGLAELASRYRATLSHKIAMLEDVIRDAQQQENAAREAERRAREAEARALAAAQERAAERAQWEQGEARKADHALALARLEAEGLRAREATELERVRVEGQAAARVAEAAARAAEGEAARALAEAQAEGVRLDREAAARAEGEAARLAEIEAEGRREAMRAEAALAAAAQAEAAEAAQAQRLAARSLTPHPSPSARHARAQGEPREAPSRGTLTPGASFLRGTSQDPSQLKDEVERIVGLTLAEGTDADRALMTAKAVGLANDRSETWGGDRVRSAKKRAAADPAFYQAYADNKDLALAGIPVGADA